MQRRRRLLVLAIVVVLVVAGGGLTAFLALRGPAPTAAERAADRLPAASPITWHACSDTSLTKLHARCGSVTVPLDWSAPAGATIRLAVSRIAHTSSTSQGVVVFDPGGPGVSGLTTNTSETALPARVRAEYDWVGYDSRGVGSSVPALTCDPHYFDGPRPGYAPTTADIAAWTTKVKAYATACATNGPILRHMTTVDDAKDLDRIRAALGEDRITFYGFSAGTSLGETYATLFPDRLRRMVLDSTVDPRSADDQYAFGQDAAFERAMDAYFAWVARWQGTYDLGSTAQEVRSRFDEVEAALAAHPVGEVGASEWHDLFLGAGYVEWSWPSLTDLFQVQANDPAGNGVDVLEREYRRWGAVGDNEFAVYSAASCTAGPISRSVPSLVAASTREAARAPYETWSNSWFSGPCLFWPVAAPTAAFRVDGTRASSVLMIDQTGDAPTPYAGSLSVRTLFPGARLIAEPGGYSHADTLSDTDACVTDRIADYLDSGALPARAAGTRADATCPPPLAPLPQDDQ